MMRRPRKTLLATCAELGYHAWQQNQAERQAPQDFPPGPLGWTAARATVFAVRQQADELRERMFDALGAGDFECAGELHPYVEAWDKAVSDWEDFADDLAQG